MHRPWERYKEKSCPTCGTKHRKKGPYCSRSCGNSRSFTPEQRKNLSVKQSEYMNSAKAYDVRDRIAAQGVLQMKKRFNKADEDLQAMTLDDFMLEPAIAKLESNQFVSDGDLWEIA